MNALYRTLLLVYPPSFRRRFGDDMADVFAQQCRDIGVVRASARLLPDLARSALVQHVEVNMNRIASSSTTALVAAAALALVVQVFGGPLVVLSLPAVIVLLALAAYRSSIVPFRETAPTAGRTSVRLLVAGAGTLLVLRVVIALFDAPWMPWTVPAFVYLVGCLTIGVGLLAGFAHLVATLRLRRRTA